MQNLGNRLTLILGGARSGKSHHAQQLAVESGKRVLFVATAEAGDQEMADRIEAHRLSRPQAWDTLEAALGVGKAILERKPSGLVLVDCLTLLASNVLGQFSEPYQPGKYRAALDEEIEGLLEAYRQTLAEWLVISNEVGLGVVPATPAGRLYRDALGQVNQRVAQVADEVVMMVAGIAVKFKG